MRTYEKQGVEVEVYPPNTPKDTHTSRDTDHVYALYPGMDPAEEERIEAKLDALEADGYHLIVSEYRSVTVHNGELIDYSF